MAQKKKLPQALDDVACALWRQGQLPKTALTRLTNMSLAGLQAYAKEHEWGEFGAGADETGEDGGAPSSIPAAAAAGDTRSLAREVEKSVRRELSAVEKRLGSPRAATAEVNARILASLVKSLSELRRLDGHGRTASQATGGEDDNDSTARPPRSIQELREELAQKLARIEEEEAGNTTAGNMEPG